MNRKEIIGILTLSRIPLGMIVATLFFFGSLSDGFGFYALALMTDVLDGYLARKMKCTSDWGRVWDRLADMIMNALSFAGYVLGAFFIWGKPITAFAPLFAIGGLMLATLPFFRRHSAASKLRSGIIRFLLIGFVAANIAWTPMNIFVVIALAIFGTPAVIHELRLTLEEVRSGERRWFKSPLPRIVK